GDGQVLMASDVLTAFGQTFTPGNNVYVSVHPDSREDADRLFRELSAGGDVEMPIADQVWGDYFGSFKDRFGVRWMINHTPAS
ncbi:MAG TPA: VOC family protein, partial [Actinomycetota bacterium]|nr:VOC family protein [Actinomycetota bacterium]